MRVGCRVQGVGMRVGCRVQGVGMRAGCRVQGVGVSVTHSEERALMRACLDESTRVQ